MSTLNGLPLHILAPASKTVGRIGDSGAQASWDGKVTSAPNITG